MQYLDPYWSVALVCAMDFQELPNHRVDIMQMLCHDPVPDAVLMGLKPVNGLISE